MQWEVVLPGGDISHVGQTIVLLVDQPVPAEVEGRAAEEVFPHMYLSASPFEPNSRTGPARRSPLNMTARTSEPCGRASRVWAAWTRIRHEDPAH